MPVSPTPPYQPSEESKGTQQALANFCHSQTPCVEIVLPTPSTPPTLLVPPSMLTIPAIPSHQPEQEAKQKTLSEKLHGLLSFAKKHYWLTAGFFVAICCIGISIYVLGATLAGITTISIFNAHPTLSGSLLFMTVYYSIFLINLCRSASKRDVLEASLEGINKQLFHSRTEQHQIHGKIKDWYAGRRAELKANYQMGRDVYGTKQLALEQLRSETNQSLLQLQELSVLIHTTLSKTQLNSLFTSQLELIRNRCNEAIAASKKALSIPIPVWEDATSLSLEPLELPEISPLVSDERQEIKKKLIERLKTQINAIFTYFKQNPVSAALMIGGLTLCGLTGIAIYHYLEGSSNIYFFGSLSLTSIGPMVIYGLSICYEGTVHASINQLERDKRDIEREMSRLRQEREEVRARYDSIWQKAHDQDTKQLQKFTDKKYDLERRYVNSVNALEKIQLQHGHVAELFKQAMIQNAIFENFITPTTVDEALLFTKLNDYAKSLLHLFSNRSIYLRGASRNHI